MVENAAAWVPVTPAKPVPTENEIKSNAKGLNHNVGSAENPQLSQIEGEIGQSGEKSSNSGSHRNQEIANNCDDVGSASKTEAQEIAKTAAEYREGVAKKASFESSELHGKPEHIIDTVNSKKSSRGGVERKPRGRMKKHRPKVFDETKPIKPRTPKPSTPKRARHVKKDHAKKKVDLVMHDDVEWTAKPVVKKKKVDDSVEWTPKTIVKKKVDDDVEWTPKTIVKKKVDDDVEWTPKPIVKKKVLVENDDVEAEVVRDCSKRSCKQKLDFDKDSCLVNDNNLNVLDTVNIVSDVETKLQYVSRFPANLKVYRRVLKPNECLKNSRKLGPNCPKVFKKRRMVRQRISISGLEKLIGLIDEKLIGLIEMVNLEVVKDGVKKSGKGKFQKKKSRQIQKASSRQIQKPSGEGPNLICNLKKKRSKRLVHKQAGVPTHLQNIFQNCMHEIGKDTLKINPKFNRCSEYVFQNFMRGAEKDTPEICPEFHRGCEQQKEMIHKFNRCSEYVFQNCMREAEKDTPEIYPEKDTLVEKDTPEIYLEKDTLVEKDIPEIHPEFHRCCEQQKEMIHKWMGLSTQDYEESTQALVDFATKAIDSLHIDDGSTQLMVRDHYHGLATHNVVMRDHGAVLRPQEKADSSKIRKVWPKVELDDETMRVWNMLMENNGTKYIEENDEKAKYWEKQRELFCGRVDSFISRMHLIQGDRRFSPWKGSVVDSVVGVFLTQNVSDYLSSSVFMTLAARYPPRSVAQHHGCSRSLVCVTHETQPEKIDKPSPSNGEEPDLNIQVELDEENRNKSSLIQAELDDNYRNKDSLKSEGTPGRKKGKSKDKQEIPIDWDDLRKKNSYSTSKIRTEHNADSVDWEAIRQIPVRELADVIVKRGMNHLIAQRIKDFLDRLVRDHGSIDLEWLRDVPPDKAKDYLLSITGLGLKSVECIRLLSLHHHAFPVDTNIGRMVVRLGWVPVQTDGVPLHLLNQYPLLDKVQKYLWPRICNLDKLTLYEWHYQGITFAKAFCTKVQPNCIACPMRRECRHYASEVESSTLRLEGSRAKDTTTDSSSGSQPVVTRRGSMEPDVQDIEDFGNEDRCNIQNCEPIIEFPASPGRGSMEPELPVILHNNSKFFPGRGSSSIDDEDDILKALLKLSPNIGSTPIPPELKFLARLRTVSSSIDDEDDDILKALLKLSPDIGSTPMPPKLKFLARLRTVHLVFELPDSHPLLARFEKREPDDPCPYLLAIWMGDETTGSSRDAEKACNCQQAGCESCTRSTDIVQYQKVDRVRGSILIPCRTANRGSFPLNGTYFQVNEVFADHESSEQPIDVPRELSIWNLRMRLLYCSTSIHSICKGMSLAEVALCFRLGFICVRGFDKRTREDKTLQKRFHFVKSRQEEDNKRQNL